MLDVCPSCRIQAPHRSDRAACPRCGGPLRVVEKAGQALNPPAVPQPQPQRVQSQPVGQHVQPSQLPPRQVQAGQAQPRGVASNPARRPTRPAPPRPNLRWTADRPAEARPAPRPQRRTVTGSTPSYRFIPRWGLADTVPDEDIAKAATVEPAALQRTLSLTTYSLAAAAVVHLIRYILVVINRSTPISVWLDLLTSAAVLVFGVCAFIAMVFALYAFARWLLSARAAAFADADRSDPRPKRLQYLLAAVPLVNVVGAPLLLAEAALTTADPTKAIERIKKVALAWALVNLLALVAIGYRIGSWFSDSVQVSADSLAITTLTFAVSAVFAHWASPRLVEILDGPARPAEAERRMVVA